MSIENEKGSVAKETCKVCREGLLNQLKENKEYISDVEAVSTKRLDAHADEIKELSRVSIELAATQKQLAQILESQEKRLRAIEDKLFAPQPKKPWYESDIGKFAIKSAIIIAILVLAAAIGKGFLDAIEPVTKVIPK